MYCVLVLCYNKKITYFLSFYSTLRNGREEFTISFILFQLTMQLPHAEYEILMKVIFLFA